MRQMIQRPSVVRDDEKQKSTYCLRTFSLAYSNQIPKDERDVDFCQLHFEFDIQCDGT